MSHPSYSPYFDNPNNVRLDIEYVLYNKCYWSVMTVDFFQSIFQEFYFENAL